MDISTALFAYGSVDFTPRGQNSNNPIIIDRNDKPFLVRWKGLNAIINPVNHVCQRFKRSERLPIRAFRRVSNGLLSIVPRDNRVLNFLNERLAGFLEHRHSIAPACFKSLIQDYECLIDPVDILDGKVVLGIGFLGYELKAGISLMASVVIGYQGADAQAVIDSMHQTTDTLFSIPQARDACLRSLRNICTLRNLPPTAMRVNIPQVDVANIGGGFADVFKCMDRGLVLAVKVLRTRSNVSLEKMTRNFYKEAIMWKFLCHPNILPLLGVSEAGPQSKPAMVSQWMMNGTIRDFVMGRGDVNRFKLLADVTKGLIYLHGRGIIHGDLKGDNILIDDGCNARIADFGMLATSDSSSTSLNEGGSSRWMSPELLDPDAFGLEGVHRTKPSDCYALGMVIYEVLSGQLPFYRSTKFAAASKALRGERPERPQGVGWFTDGVWEILVHCWKHQPSDRPSVDDVLNPLGVASNSWTPLEEGPQGVDPPQRTSPGPSSISS